MAIKVLIVEDNPITAQDIEEILIENGIQVVGTARSYQQAVAKANSLLPDILLVDIKLDSNKDGIDAVKTIYQTNFIPAVYLTANSDMEHAKKAFSTSPASFLSKPFNQKDLLNSIELAFSNHCINIFNSNDLLDMTHSIFLKSGDKYEKVPLKEIEVIEADGSYSTIFAKSNKYSISLNLQNLKEKIQNHLFLRVHRSYVINVNCISGFDKQHVFIGNRSIPYSKNYKEDLFKFLNRV